ncbi:HAD family phosphatase [Brachybacterium sp. GPGPB12]|uniref:HAD family hydrolase n=1 Tax=Brachybacterium sp. GPGPB12 TaxID=3023517 RepID=UPI0031342B7F
MSTSPDRFARAFGDWTPRAVVFDCDGLLLDTESVWRRAQDTVVAARGAVLAPEDDAVAARLDDRGRRRADRPPLRPHRGRGPRRPAPRVRPRALRRGAHPARRGRGACGRRRPGCRWVRASNSWLEALDHKLVAGGLREHFTVLEASDTVENPKPAPDMYAAAARALGQRPEDCLALEDSGTGARAARDAGSRLIAVPAPGHPVPPADLALTSLTDPELAAWIATW